MLELEPRTLTLSAVKPASNSDGLIVRVLNPTDHNIEAQLRVDGPTTSVTAVRLDETPTGHTIRTAERSVAFDIPPHALRSVLIH